MYDMGFFLIPANFVLLGTLAGGFASTVKKWSGVDWRGRILELAVVIATVALSILSWGLVKAFFGIPNSCFGFLGGYHVHETDMMDSSTYILRGIRALILRPAAKLYIACDHLFAKSPSLLRTALCTQEDPNNCFEHLPFANPNFFLVDENSSGDSKCAADTLLFIGLYLMAGTVFLSSILIKQHERRQRRRLRLQQQQQFQQPQRFMGLRGQRPPPPQHLHQD
jgi:hypothetical protein